MENIVLCRIDSRLIHGQVMTKWVQQSQATRIVIVSDALAKDDFMKEIYLMSAPVGLEVVCLSVEEALREQEKLNVAKTLLLLPNLDTLNQLVKSGISLQEVQIGGLGGAPSRKVVLKNITLDDADVAILKGMENYGINVYFQIIPEDAPQPLSAILGKYESMNKKKGEL